MKYDLTQIDQHFPLKSYRPGQKTIIEKILQSFNDGIKFVLLEAPTGTGKSAIGQTITQFMDNSYYLAPQKFLQDQLTDDFGEDGKHVAEHAPMIDLKGRNAYPCTYWENQLNIPNNPNPKLQRKETLERFERSATEKLGCDVGECKRDGKSSLDYCVKEGEVKCPYFTRLYRAMSSKIVLMNFHSFLYQSSFTEHFGHRSLLIIDEAHNTETILMDFVQLSISDRSFMKYNIKIPKLSSVADYMKFFEDNNLRTIIQEELKVARLTNKFKDEEEWAQILHRYNILVDSDPKEWVCDWQENQTGTVHTVVIKPIHVDKFAHDHLFNLADHVLMMSATILSKKAVCESLGIPADNVKSFRLGSNFPKERRPIYYRPSGSMGFKNKETTLPKMMSDIEQICKHHSDERGIIHTHTNAIMKYIKENASKELSKRLIDQSGAFETKQDMIGEHKIQKNGILIAPAMHEGLDLKDDLGRFQVICKVPYASMMDPQIAKRKEESNEYYNWLAATKLIQAYGRIMRHKDDYGLTYVLDADFKNFINRNGEMCPGWFKEAIVWEGE